MTGVTKQGGVFLGYDAGVIQEEDGRTKTNVTAEIVATTKAIGWACPVDVFYDCELAVNCALGTQTSHGDPDEARNLADLARRVEQKLPLKIEHILGHAGNP